eukprot:TRINITY_DN2873_c0_g1_i1.p1 TRINITY_DN2873_c0_g1~~TRINITY_DN2873_c0_g1_i1.p1  ORF type:complete len:512 (+),score=75.42 TRINITY_DN2873_c0_g1_i1:90-1625(+)
MPVADPWGRTSQPAVGARHPALRTAATSGDGTMPLRQVLGARGMPFGPSVAASGADRRGRAEQRCATPPQGVPGGRQPPRLPSPASTRDHSVGRRETTSLVTVEELHTLEMAQIGGLRLDEALRLPPPTRGTLPFAPNAVVVSDDTELAPLRRGLVSSYSTKVPVVARLEGSALRVTKTNGSVLIIVPYGEIRRVETWSTEDRGRCGVRIIAGSGAAPPEIVLLAPERAKRTMLHKLLQLKSTGAILPVRDGTRRPQSPQPRQAPGPAASADGVQPHLAAPAAPRTAPPLPTPHPSSGPLSPSRVPRVVSAAPCGGPAAARAPAAQAAAPAAGEPPRAGGAPPSPPGGGVVHGADVRQLSADDAPGHLQGLPASEALLARAEAEHLLRGPGDEGMDRVARRERIRQELESRRRDGRSPAPAPSAAAAPLVAAEPTQELGDDGGAQLWPAPAQQQQHADPGSSAGEPPAQSTAASAAELDRAERRRILEARLQQERDRRKQEARPGSAGDAA